MTAEVAAGSIAGEMSPRQRRVTKALDVVGLIITLATVIGGILWAFPLYWAIATTLKPDLLVTDRMTPFTGKGQTNFAEGRRQTGVQYRIKLRHGASDC